MAKWELYQGTRCQAESMSYVKYAALRDLETGA